MQFFAVLSYRLDPSFLWSSPFPGCIHVAVVCYLGVSFILHPIQVPKVSQLQLSRLFCILSIIPHLMFSLLNIFSFLILSLLVTPSIFRRHAISNALSLCFSLSLRLHMSTHTVPHTCMSLWPCTVPWGSTPSKTPAKFPSPTQFSILVRQR